MVALIWALLGPSQIWQDAVVAGEDAYLVLPPECACGTNVTQAQWSSGGRHILLTRDYTRITAESVRRALESGEGDGTERGKFVLASYDVASRVYREIMVWEHRPAEMQWLGWVPNSARAIFHVRREDPSETVISVFLVDAASGKTREIPFSALTPHFAFSPKKPLIAAVDAAELVLLDHDGTKVKSLKVERKFAFFTAAWGENMEYPVFSSSSGGQTTWFEWNYDSDLLREVRAPALSRSVVAPVYLDFASSPTGRGTAILRSSAPSEFSAATISSEASLAQLNSRMDAVLYASNGALFVRPILKVPKALLEELIAKAVQQDAMTRAREIANAINLFAADHNDNLPPADDFNRLLEPYLRSQKVLDGFVPTYTARSFRDIADPSSTLLGYIETPRGRANAYADGSVRFAQRA